MPSSAKSIHLSQPSVVTRNNGAGPRTAQGRGGRTKNWEVMQMAATAEHLCILTLYGHGGSTHLYMAMVGRPMLTHEGPV